MEKDWVAVETYSLSAIAELKKAVLLENGVEAVVISHQSSSYLIGNIELYVHRDDVLTAKRILDENLNNE